MTNRRVSSTPSHFPIMMGEGRFWLPWHVVSKWEGQIRKNHQQTLFRLADRGGLSIQELWCAATDRAWNQILANRHSLEWWSNLLVKLTREGTIQ